jgi:hypothetical protein
VPIFRRGPAENIQTLSERDLDDVLALVATTLGSELVPDPQRLRDPDEAARIDLPSVIAHLRGQPRTSWPGFVASFYAANVDEIRRGNELESRVSDFEQARRFLAAILERGDPGLRTGVALPGLLPGTRYVLVLQDGNTVRVVLPSTVSRWGVTPGDALTAARERARTATATESPFSDRPSIRLLDTAPDVWSALALEVLDDVRPDAIGPLGTLASLLAPNLALVRALDFRLGLRDDLAAMTSAHASWLAEHPDAVHQNLLWRRMTGEVVEIDMSLAASGQGLRLNIVDPRFLGVLTAVEPTAWLPVPPWAPRGMSPEAYTRFAGIFSASMASGGVPPDQVATVSHEVVPVADLARICQTVDVDDWPRVLGMSTRIGVRTSLQPSSDLAGYQPRGFVEVSGGNLPAGLRSVIGEMPQIVRAGIYGGYAVRAASGDPVAKITEGPFEIDLVVLVGHRGDGDITHDIDLLQAACAVFMPSGVHTVVEPTRADDPRFEDEEHLLTLK